MVPVNVLRRLFSCWIKPKCRHVWRPALFGVGGKPTRTCGRCGAWENLSEAEFYAQFGRIPKEYHIL